MKQHPIPQNILDVEFKLFTKFTVREFTYMSIGVGFGGIFLYFFSKAQLSGFIAIPVFIISSGIGLFLGLVPINGQKADTFLANYIKAITKPTRRAWRNDQFNEKVEGIAEERGLTLTQGSMNRNEDPASPNSSKQNIIGGFKSSDDISSQQFVKEAQISQQLDAEEEARLREIEQIAEQEIPESNKEVSTADTSQPKDLEINSPQTQEELEKPEVKESVVPKVETVKSSPTVQNTTPTITIDKNSIYEYAVEIEDLELKPNTIYLHIRANDQPVHRAMITVKDENENILYAYQTNIDGNLISAKPLNPGTYLVDIDHAEYNFPRLKYVIENEVYPAVMVEALN
jgi:hypothetical protein